MAKPNYGYQKRQKELAKQKKKEERKQRKSETSDAGDEHEQLEMAVTQVRERMQSMSPDSDLYHLGENVLANLDHHPEDMSLEMARLFLERTDEQA